MEKKFTMFICSLCNNPRFSFVKNDVAGKDICNRCLSLMTVENLITMYLPEKEKPTLIFQDKQIKLKSAFVN